MPSPVLLSDVLVTDGQAVATILNDDPQDSDGDGMPDPYEETHGFNPADPLDANYDTDGDGVNNLDEYRAGSDPRDPDTDGDGIRDGYDGDVTTASNACIGADAIFENTLVRSGEVAQCVAERSALVADSNILEPGATLEVQSPEIRLSERFSLPVGAQLRMNPPFDVSRIGARLIAHWGFEQVSGTQVVDESGNGNDGVLYDGAIVDDRRVSGAAGLNLTQVGSGNREEANPTMQITGPGENLRYFETGDEPFSYFVHFFPLDVGTDYAQYIFGNHASNAGTGRSDHAGWLVRLRDGRLRLYLYRFNDDVIDFEVPVDATWENQWHSIALTRKGDRVSFYVDGAKVTQVIDSRADEEVFGHNGVMRAFSLGGIIRNWFGDIYYRDSFRGSLDNAMIFDSELTIHEVQNLHEMR